MRRSSLAAAAVALMVLSGAACAGARPASVSVAPIPDAAIAEPLVARLYQPVGQTVRFALSRPAYVAVFEVVPGHGVSMLYPAAYDAAASKPTPAGFNLAYLAPVNFGRMYYYSSYADREQEPSYLYLLASESPLDIAPLVRNPGALRGMIGGVAFSRAVGPRLMDLVDRAVVRETSPERWTADYVVLWPDESPPRVQVPRYLVQCSDDRLILLDPLDVANQTVIGCRQPRVVMPVPRDSTPPADSARKLPPPRRARDSEPADRGGDRRAAAPVSLAVRFRDGGDRPERDGRLLASSPSDRAVRWRDERARPGDDSRRPEPPVAARPEPRRADPPPPPPPPPAAKTPNGRE